MKVMIVGVGKLGYKLAESMINEDIDVTLVDSSTKVIERLNDYLDVLTVNANGVEVSILKELNIETYDLLIAATSSDETNTIICSLAKKLGCKKTIARMRNPEYTKQIEFIKNEMGIDHIVNPDLETAGKIGRYILKCYNFYSGNFAKGKVQMVDFNVNNMSGFVGKRVKDLDGMGEALIAAISRDGETIIPDGSTELRTDDIVYIIGKSKSINGLANRFKFGQNKKQTKKVMILGGGKIGYYLAEKLTEANVNVTIIEKDRERCKYLIEKLNTALVIRGDGTDFNLLEEESLSEMDAFIGATGYDEQNILMCLMAKQANVNKVIAKISRPNYINAIDKLDIDVAINPVNIITSDILKFIRGGRVVSVSLLLGDQAEVVEVIVSEGLSIVGKKISDLNLPRGLIIGSVVHDGKVIIPNGDTVINANDRIIIFCLTQNIQEMNKFLRPRKGDIFSELWHRN